VLACCTVLDLLVKSLLYCNHVSHCRGSSRQSSHGSMHRNWALGEVPEMEAVRELPRRVS